MNDSFIFNGKPWRRKGNQVHNVMGSPCYDFEFSYKDKWHRVVNYSSRAQATEMLMAQHTQANIPTQGQQAK